MAKAKKSAKAKCGKCGQEEGYCDTVKAKQTTKALFKERKKFRDVIITKLQAAHDLVVDKVYDNPEVSNILEVSEANRMMHAINAAIEVTYDVLPIPELDDAVSLAVIGYGVTSYEPGTIVRIDYAASHLWLEDSSRTFDLKTGDDIVGESLGMRVKVLFDHGRAFRQHEDEYLGEGDSC